MNKREKEVIQYQLDKEKAVLKKLEQQYQRALNDIINKTKILQADIDMLQAAGEADDRTLSMVRSKVYQKQYQQALQQQIKGVLDKLHSDEYSTIQGFLNGCYEDGFIGTMYSLQAQGIPVIAPIDTSAAVKAVQLDSKVVEGYYKHLGVDFDNLKKVIPQEVSRGIASSLPYTDIARNLNNASKSGLNNAKRIARTEGHRIQQQSADDARAVAKKKGADVVKQWDASLDSRTRDSHRRVDGEIRENDEKFSNGLMYAGDPNGGAAEVINCRCVTLTRAKWALDEEELDTLKERAEYFGLDKTENFEDYKKKYLKAAKETVENSVNVGTIVSAQYPEYSRIIRDVDAIEDAKNANPNYSKQTYEYTHNCQRCVPAWELRQRGFDVVAQPCKPFGERDALKTSPFSLWDFNAFDSDVSKRVQVDRDGTGKEKIIEFLKASGNGSRVEIVVAWEYDPDNGHAFAAKNIDGNIVFIDPQSGRSGQLVEEYFDRVVKGETRWLRIDNLPLAERFRNEVIANPYE